MAGEITDPRVKAILLGGGAGIASAPFAIGAAQDALKKRATEKQFQKRISDRKERLAQRYGQQVATQAPKSGIMSALGRMAGPVGGVAGALIPTQMGDGTLQGDEVMMQGNTDEALSRPMFVETAQALEELDSQIEGAEDFASMMDAIRGDQASVEERRTELGQLVGSADAEKTPESVLTLIQPTLGILEAAESDAFESEGTGITSGLVDQAPGQEEAIARMAMGEQPVMRSDGTKEGGEKIGTALSGLDTVKALQALVPQPTSYDTYLQQFQDRLGDSKTGFELNPYIASLNLASAIANAPKGELLSSVLAPETIKSVSDPILQMAQAKSKTDQAIKLKALDAASKAQTSAASAKSDIMMKAIPELMKGDDFQAYSAGNDTIILNKRTGQYETITGDTEYDSVTLGDGRVALVNKADRNDVTYLGTAKGENKFDIKPVTGGALVTNKQTGDVEFKPIDNMPIDFTVHGNAENGFFKMDKAGNVTPLDETKTGIKTGPSPTDLKKNIDALSAARSKLNGMIEQGTSSTDQDFINTQAEIKALALATTPLQGSEFERLLEQKAQMIYDSTQGTEAQKKQARDVFVAKTLDDYINAKNTVRQGYNPNEALDKEFAGMFGKQVESINKGADNARKLQGLADTAVLASNKFQTGAFAETRLNITKMVKAVGGETALRNAIGEERFNDLFSDTLNDVKSGELVKSIGAQFAVMMAESFPGNLNQSEVQLIIDAGPNIGVSGEGLKTLQKVFADANRRAQLESKYATDFLQADENQGMSAEAKYAKFNQGLAEIRAANPVITREMVEALEANTASGAVPEGALAVKNASGERGFVPANQVGGFNAVKNAPDKNTFIANFRQLQATNPGLEGLDAGTFYDSMINLVKVN